jgi:hypothetical protein
MSKHVLLDHIEHRDLRVIGRRGAELGDDIMATLTFPSEFRDVQAHYPIVFAKSPEGVITPLALFGFKEKQNLFLDAPGWDVPYVPMMVERQPFFIGRGANQQKTVHIDLDSPRVSRTEGAPLFDAQGANSEFLDRAGSILMTIEKGIAQTPAFVAALTQHNLLESFVIDLEMNGAQHRFAGFHTVQEERLAKLGAEALGRLHDQGYLQAIFMVVASLSNFRGLAERVRRLHKVR